MADPIRRRPPLQVVREGNPGKRPVNPGVILPAADLVEPEWRETFPTTGEASVRGENARARNIAAKEWRRIVPVLTRTAGLADIDLSLVHDYCIVIARIDQGERAISRAGVLQLGERGWQKNGWTTILSQYRGQLARYVRELGLSPSARSGITPSGDGDGDDDPFD